MKPYYVELTIGVVVMAQSWHEAMRHAEMDASDIVSDSELRADSAIAVTSLEHLHILDPDWDGECCPYGDDESRTLADILPESDPFVDTKTVDMFAAA